MRINKKVALTTGGVLGSASAAMATGPTSLIDYASAASDLESLLTTAVTAAIGVGIIVLGTRFGWRMFKSFTK